MKKFLAHNTTQAVLNITCAVFIILSVMISLIGGNQAFIWMYITAMVLCIVFLVYNTWVSDYLNRKEYDEYLEHQADMNLEDYNDYHNE